MNVEKVVSEENLEKQEDLVQQDLPDQQAHLGSLENVDHLVPLDLQDLQDLKVPQVREDQLVLRVKLEHVESQE